MKSTVKSSLFLLLVISLCSGFTWSNSSATSNDASKTIVAQSKKDDDSDDDGDDEGDDEDDGDDDASFLACDGDDGDDDGNSVVACDGDGDDGDDGESVVATA